MRHIDDRLGEGLKTFAVDLVEHQRDENRRGEAGNQAIEIQQERMDKQALAVIGTEKILKMLQSHPRAAVNAQNGFIIFKGNLHAVHGQIVDKIKIENRGQQQHIKLPVVFQPLADSAPKAAADRTSRCSARYCCH